MKKGWLKRVGPKLNACKHIIVGTAKPCYSQTGEDSILNFLFQSLGISKPRYVDIGANEPVRGSNTYFFYCQGASGICVEPDPRLYKSLCSTRSRDICINAGISSTEALEADFYVYPRHQSGWNTFSREEAELRTKNGNPYSEVMHLPLYTVNEIISRHLGQAPDLLSIDTEGLDFDIVKSLDFQTLGPKVLVLETLRFGENIQEEVKQHDMIQYVLSKGYVVYADTYVNTIFLKTELS